MGALLSSNWAAAELGGRLRIGPGVWLNLAGSVTLRPGEVDEPNAVYWTVPIRLGARWLHFLDSSPLYFGLGGDAQLLIFPGCLDGESCASGVTLRPGVVASGIAGLVLNRSVALEVELHGGIHGFTLTGSQDESPAVLPQVGLVAGLVVQL